jgi:hypothetical protein
MKKRAPNQPSSPLNNQEIARPERMEFPPNPRYRRIRFLSELMDQSIVLPNGYRIGLDPLLGLMPGIGDLLGAAISSYLVYECARLGVPKRVLGKMAGNIAVEAIVGVVPVVGDVFDAAWKANMRNLRLLESCYRADLEERSPRQIFLFLALGLGLFLMGLGALMILVIAGLVSLLESLFQLLG